MPKAPQVRYICSECGHSEPKWVGRCPKCGAWNTYSEEKVFNPKLVSGANNIEEAKLRPLSSVPYEKNFRLSSGISELDRVLGGGVMKPSSVLVGGEPGIGKSTLMLQMASNLASKGMVMYVSGEESPSQVRLRGERLGVDLDNINFFSDIRLEPLMEIIRVAKPDYIIVDSLQTLYSVQMENYAGNPAQMKASATELIQLAKSQGAAIFFIGHITKDGTIAGPKIIEHLVDTVLYFEGVESGMRLLRATKNRFGSIDEIGLFFMSSDGLRPVLDPSEFFLASRDREEFPSGIVFTPVVEGSRTFIVEIQSLVIPSKNSYPRIYSDKIDPARISRIAAILDRHARVTLTDSDIYVNVAGGMRLSEGSIDLALAIALCSSKLNTPIDMSSAFFGELSLAGEVRPVPFADRRVKALRDMGFESIYTLGSKDISKTGIIGVRNIRGAVITAFKKK